MSTEASQNSRVNEYIYTPPILPSHLAAIHDLKPIVGSPNDEDVKKIHAAMRAVNLESQGGFDGLRTRISNLTDGKVSYLYDPDLILQLSQHLFSVQMVVYRNTYPQNLFPGDNTYTPPPLPAYIPIALEPVLGAPSNEQLKAAQSAMRVSESLAGSPLFDSNLSMKLSQHLFNLQFARYSQDSTLDRFNSTPEAPRPAPPTIQGLQTDLSTTQGTIYSGTEGICATPPGPTQNSASEARVLRPSVAEPENLGCCATSSIGQLGESVNTIKELLNGSKGVLENMNRMLIAIQRGQVILWVGKWEDDNYTHANPVNQHGMSATECGLPQLRYSYRRNQYWTHLNSPALAGYLKFFGVGAHLIEGDESPRLKDGRESEAKALIFKQIGLGY